MKIDSLQGSRIGKKQVCCYIPRHFHLHIVNYARCGTLTHQQALANIINSYCKSIGKPLSLPGFEPKPPPARRKRGKAVIRRNASSPYRKTRMAISGWYPKGDVESLKEIAKTQGQSLQKFCETAIIEKARELSDSAAEAEDREKSSRTKMRKQHVQKETASLDNGESEAMKNEAAHQDSGSNPQDSNVSSNSINKLDDIFKRINNKT